MKQKMKITVKEFIKAVKKADRAIALENSSGFKSTTSIHKSKKTYNRKEGKKIDFESSFLFLPITNYFSVMPY